MPDTLDTPLVAVITRTKDRPLLLQRALESVSGQSLTDIQWVIVNDGGEPAPVDAVADAARKRGLLTSVLHHSTSLGMESASNRGLRGSQSKYVVIHDDDDSWDTRFLDECVAFLGSRPHYRGVCTQCLRIEERVTSTEVVLKSTKPWNPWLKSVQFADLVKVNQFPPISFVFHREVFDQLGYFDESLPVLGDWDFNLRFLCKFDIGVIPLPLANYHHRCDFTTATAYGNSLYAAVDKHVEFDAIIRNRHIRSGLAAGTIDLGGLLTIGFLHHSSTAERLAAGFFGVAQRVGLITALRRLFRL